MYLEFYQQEDKPP